jgi:alpha-beta hydrolase superfamily lysophospholipase
MRIFDLLNRRTELPTPDPPAEVGRRDGLAYALFLPEGQPRGGVLIVHGAGSCKESHFDFARACRSAGYAAVAYDQRGHGESEGCLDGRVLEDAAAMAALLPDGPLVLRGSSLGGYVALLAAARLDAAAVVAICPAGSEDLLRGLRAGSLDFEADALELERFLEAHDLARCVAELRTPMLLLHAEGDEQIPVEHSNSLYRAARMPRKRLIALPGGHHRSIQHDPELQGEALRFIDKSLAADAS